MSEEKYKLYLPKTSEEYFMELKYYDPNSFVRYINGSGNNIKLELEIVLKSPVNLVFKRDPSRIIVENNWHENNKYHGQYCTNCERNYKLIKDNKLNRKLYAPLASNGGYIVVEK